jgi:hypothetical protein
VAITHSCRERHVSNILEGNEVEIDDENLKDFEVEEKEDVELETVPMTSQDHQSMKNLPTTTTTTTSEEKNEVDGVVLSLTTSTNTTSSTVDNSSSTLVRRKYTDEVKDDIKEVVEKKKKKVNKLNGCCGIGRNVTCFLFEKTIGDYLESLWNGLKKKILLYCIALIFGISLM